MSISRCCYITLACVSSPVPSLSIFDSSVYLFSHNWVTWSLLIVERETGKRISIWLFSLNDEMARERGFQNGFWVVHQLCLPHVLILAPKRPSLVTRMILIEARHA